MFPVEAICVNDLHDVFEPDIVKLQAHGQETK